MTKRTPSAQKKRYHSMELAPFCPKPFQNLNFIARIDGEEQGGVIPAC